MVTLFYEEKQVASGLVFNCRLHQITINNWALQSAAVLEPFHDHLKKLLIAPDMNVSNINIDEPWLGVTLNKALGRDKNYVFCYSAITKHG